MEGEKYISIIEKRLSQKRFIHSLNVAEAAVQLCRMYGGDEQKAYTAGILHDICKEERPDYLLQLVQKYDIVIDGLTLVTQKLHHAKAGAIFVEKELGITDTDIINAISYHTTARGDMSQLEKIIYLADYIGKERDYDGVEDMRRETYASMDRGLKFALQFTVGDLLNRNRAIHPDTLDAYNSIIIKNASFGGNNK